MRLRGRLALTMAIAAVPLLTALWLVWREMEQRAVADSLREFAVAHMTAIGRTRCQRDPVSYFEVFPPPLPPRRPDMGPGGRRAPPRDGNPVPFPRDARDGAPPDGVPPDGPRDGPPREGGPARGPRPQSRPASPSDSVTLRTELWAYGTDMVAANPRAPAMPAALAAGMRAGDDIAIEPYAAGDTSGYQALVRMPWTTSACDYVLVRRTGPHLGEVERAFLWGGGLVCLLLLGTALFAAGPMVGRIRRLTAGVRRAASDRYGTTVEARGHDEIAELARAFNDAGEQVRAHLTTIERREQTLRDFVANSTHDVMLPLTVLQGHLTTLRDTPFAPRETVLEAMEEAQYLASLVHNLSAAARLEGAHEPERHPVCLNDLVERVVARHRPIARPREIAIDYAVPEQPLRITGDVTLLEQALNNVVHNAVRYNRPGGHVAVVLEERVAGGSMGFSLRVIDDGPGVPDDQIARLTERAFRTDQARSREPGGLGLGLSIARAVAERHGLCLDLRRSEHGGLEVEIRTPAAGAGPHAPA